MPKHVSIPFFMDQNVPDSVGKFLETEGHTVVRLREVMATTTPDPVIAVACTKNGHVLVSHDKDFRQIAKRLNITQRQYQQSLHKITLECPEPEDVARLKDSLSLIEHEWQLAREDRPMVIGIRSKSIYIRR